MRRRGGFDPSRLSQAPRPNGIVRHIVGQEESAAKGFTEVRAIGVGGAGSNALNRLIETGINGIRFNAVNTDNQALSQSQATVRLQIGLHLTNGLGTGGDPAKGKAAALESEPELRAMLRGADMAFVAAGLGGGTGTGAGPIVARIAREEGALTVGVVTRPFAFEGMRRKRIADQGLIDILAVVDALLVVPNDRLLELSSRKTQLTDAFKLADDVMLQGIRGIADLITTTGLINVDFADVRAVLSNGGLAHMAVGLGMGPNRGIDAARRAIASPLLETPLRGARSVLLNCVGGPDLTLADAQEAAEVIAREADPEAEIIFGAFIHPKMAGELQLTIIAAGLPELPRRP